MARCSLGGEKGYLRSSPVRGAAGPVPEAARRRCSGLAVRDDRLLLLGGSERGAARTHLRQVHYCRLTDGGAVITGRAS
ncbi:hypothetical protein Sxan_03010 [Streptomyces xanthophaeus]|uniref:Uncharacterized protein n=1 Tax=Streptomyces xanthophaeus TaxID=67385 RepID=A0A919LD44_9ACTN|nr:hypothetical protein Sxan_03010 [Streptomyces xanthophaeus]